MPILPPGHIRPNPSCTKKARPPHKVDTDRHRPTKKKKLKPKSAPTANTNDSQQSPARHRPAKRSQNELEEEEEEEGEEREEREQILLAAETELQHEIRRNRPKTSKRRNASRKKLQESGGDIDWAPSNIIRLLPRECDIMLDPDAGFDFAGDTPSPAEHPTKNEFPEKDKKIKVGIATGGAAPMIKQKGKAGDKEETLRMGESVFIRLAARPDGYEYCDAFGTYVSMGEVRLDPRYRPENAKIEAVAKLGRVLREFDEVEQPKYEQQMRMWRYDRRYWELDLIQKEWARGNKKIFSPNFSEETIERAKEFLNFTEGRDRDREVPAHFIGRPKRRMILAPRGKVPKTEKDKAGRRQQRLMAVAVDD